MAFLFLISLGLQLCFLPSASCAPTSPEQYSALTRRSPPHHAAPASYGAPYSNYSCQNAPGSRNCWGGGFSIDTDSAVSWPVTGKTKSYTLEITNTTMSPEGHERLVFAINGQYPGPVVEADWGDTLAVTVINNLQYNGTSIHFHGMMLPNANNMDGTNGITECPLAPGDSKTYTFVATQHGTSWYHSHHSSQYGDGVYGPVVINGPATADYDIDLGPIAINDWYYLTATQIEHIMLDGTPPLTADNGLINGKMKHADGVGGSYSNFKLQPGKTHRLRLINSAVDNHFKVHLDGHNMTIISADFVPVEPQVVDWLFVGIGERYDVLVTADQEIDNYWFRAEVQTDCGKNTNNGNIMAIFSYDGVNKTGEPTSQKTEYTVSCDDQTGLAPWVKKDVPKEQFSAQVEELEVLLSIGTKATYSVNGSAVVQWSFDDKLMSIDWQKPTLEYVFNGDSNWTESQNLIELPAAHRFTFWIIQALVGDYGTAPHPIHLHGHDFYVLGAGQGNFTSADQLNFVNPIRRDVAMMPMNGWLVLAFETNNPGAWLMHCHVAWHVSEGFALQFLERKDEIPDLFQLDDEYYRVCNNWEEYSKSAVYHQFESGMR